MKTEVSKQIFKKYSNIKFHEDPSTGNRVVPCGWTDGDGHDETSKCFSKICEHA